MSWKTPPKYGTKNTLWQPGEARSYMPVVNFGVPMNIPAGGLVGKTVNQIGDKRVTFVIRGEKTAGTNARKPGGAK